MLRRPLDEFSMSATKRVRLGLYRYGCAGAMDESRLSCPILVWVRVWRTSISSLPALTLKAIAFSPVPPSPGGRSHGGGSGRRRAVRDHRRQAGS